eukprot:gene19284-30586_t
MPLDLASLTPAERAHTAYHTAGAHVCVGLPPHLRWCYDGSDVPELLHPLAKTKPGQPYASGKVHCYAPAAEPAVEPAVEPAAEPAVEPPDAPDAEPGAEPAAAQPAALSAGDAWRGTYYPGVISAVNEDGTFCVEWEDETITDNIAAPDVRRCDVGHRIVRRDISKRFVCDNAGLGRAAAARGKGGEMRAPRRALPC